MTEAEMNTATQDIVVEEVLPHAPETIWKTLTTGELIDRWLMKSTGFAIMALVTRVLGGGMPDMPCSAAEDASPLSGMVPMYLLRSEKIIETIT